MHVEITVFSGNLIGNALDVDEMASTRRYVGLLALALLERWPGVDLDMHVERAEGVTPPTRVYVGDEEMPALEEEVDAIAEHVWAAHEWVVDTVPQRTENEE